MKPVLYLDVDGVLLQFPPHRTKEWWDANNIEGCVPAEGAKGFLLLAKENFEVRWLTAWATSGTMRPDPAQRLAKALGVTVEDITSIVNPLSWRNNKTEGINWEEHAAGRKWLWIDDEAGPNTPEGKELERRGAVHNYIKVDTSNDPRSLEALRQAMFYTILGNYLGAKPL